MPSSSAPSSGAGSDYIIFDKKLNAGTKREDNVLHSYKSGANRLPQTTHTVVRYSQSADDIERKLALLLIFFNKYCHMEGEELEQAIATARENLLAGRYMPTEQDAGA